MKYRRKLFMSKGIYDLQSADTTFISAMKANVAFHMQNCSDYKNVLENLGFDLNSIHTFDDLSKIPPLPTSFLKNNSLLSKPYNRLLIKTTSSGTGGKRRSAGLMSVQAYADSSWF